MRFLSQFFVEFFASIVGFFVKRFSAKVALATGYAATLLTMTLTFYGIIRGLILALSSSITNEWLLMGFYAIWPGNAELCISTIITASFAGYMFRHYRSALFLISSAQ